MVMNNDELMLRIRSAWEGNDLVLADSLISELKDIVDSSEEEKIPESIINIWIRILFKIEKYDDCIKKCNEILDHNPDSWDAEIFIARSYASLGNKQKSIKYYKKLIEKNPQNSEPYVVLIRQYYKDGNFNISLKYVEELLKNDSDNRNGLLFKARIYSINEGINKSLDAYMKLYEKYPDDIEANGRIGQKLYELERFDKSRDFLLNTLRLDPQYRPARRLIGLCLDRLGETSDAIDYLYLEAEKEPGIISNWKKIIDVYLKVNKEDKIKKVIEDASHKIPDRIDALTTGYSLSRSILWKEGMEKYISFLDKEFKDDFRANQQLFDIAMNIGDVSLARISLNKMDIANKNNKNNDIFNKYSSKFENILNLTRTSYDEIDKKIKLEEDIYISELVIRRICQIAEQQQRRRPSIKNHKVVHISSSLGRGGAERQLAIGVTGLKKTYSSIDISVMTHKPNSEKGTYGKMIRDAGIEIIHYGSSKRWEDEFNGPNINKFQKLIDLLPLAFKRDLVPLTKAFIKNKPTVVHSWQDQTNIIVGIAGLIARVPIIIMFGRSMRPDGKTMLHIRNRPYLKSAYLTLLKSKNVALYLNSNAGRISYSEWLNIDNKKLTVMHNGINFDIMKKNQEKQRVEDFCDKYNLDNYEYVVGGVFRFVKEKRLELWVESAKNTIDKRNDVIFIAVGDGPEMEKCLQLVGGTPYQDSILCPGFTENVSSWFEIFDMFLLTSMIEGLPNVLIEAQAYGIPVISTPAGGSADTFLNYKSGLILKN